MLVFRFWVDLQNRACRIPMICNIRNILQINLIMDPLSRPCSCPFICLINFSRSEFYWFFSTFGGIHVVEKHVQAHRIVFKEVWGGQPEENTPCLNSWRALKEKKQHPKSCEWESIYNDLGNYFCPCLHYLNQGSWALVLH